MKFSKIKLLILSVAVLLIGFSVFVVLKTERGKPARTAIKRQWLILTGKLVSVGEHRLRIECRGSGSPTVVMDAGLNMPLDSWGTVPNEIGKFSRVCVYERAGLGDSDKPPTIPRTSEDIVRELHTLLQNSGEKSPYLLVGHSFGGINARLYASLYPQEVSGLVLIDASHEDQYERIAALKSPDERQKYLRHEGGANHEKADLLTSAAQIRKAPPLPNIPLVVLSAQRNVSAQELPEMQIHDELQTALSKLNNQGQLIVVSESGHFIQLDKPEAVVDAVRSIFEKTRK